MKVINLNGSHINKSWFLEKSPVVQGKLFGFTFDVVKKRFNFEFVDGILVYEESPEYIQCVLTIGDKQVIVEPEDIIIPLAEEYYNER